MPLQGTIVNIIAVIIGALIGRYLGHLIPEKIRSTIVKGLGLAVLVIGMQLAMKTNNVLIVIGGLFFGGIIGEVIGIEAGLENIGNKLQDRFSDSGNVAEAFVTASLLYCIGAMAIMGSIQDGLGDTPSILYAKSALDGIASVALASTLGIGVIFSIIPLLLYQGSITLAAGWVQGWLTEPVVDEMSAVGGLLILAIGLDILDIKRLPIGNLLPGIFVAMGIAIFLG
jgi:uncharacterized membrane protein YqgA involved in biofilm formation